MNAQVALVKMVNHVIISVNGYACRCVPGLTGTKCQQNIDECKVGPCDMGDLALMVLMSSSVSA